MGNSTLEMCMLLPDHKSIHTGEECWGDGDDSVFPLHAEADVLPATVSVGF